MVMLRLLTDIFLGSSFGPIEVYIDGWLGVIDELEAVPGVVPEDTVGGLLGCASSGISGLVLDEWSNVSGEFALATNFADAAGEKVQVLALGAASGTSEAKGSVCVCGVDELDVSLAASTDAAMTEPPPGTSGTVRFFSGIDDVDIGGDDCLSALRRVEADLSDTTADVASGSLSCSSKTGT